MRFSPIKHNITTRREFFYLQIDSVKYILLKLTQISKWNALRKGILLKKKLTNENNTIQDNPSLLREPASCKSNVNSPENGRWNERMRK